MWNGKLRYRLLELLAQFQVSIPATNPTGKWGATNRAAVKLVGVYELVASLEHEFAGIVGTAQEAVGRNGVGTGPDNSIQYDCSSTHVSTIKKRNPKNNSCTNESSF